MTQIVFKAGNSNVVAIPAEVAKKTGITKGSKVVVETSVDGDLIVISKVGPKRNQSRVTPEFLGWLDKFNKEYGPALKELSKK